MVKWDNVNVAEAGGVAGGRVAAEMPLERRLRALLSSAFDMGMEPRLESDRPQFDSNHQAFLAKMAALEAIADAARAAYRKHPGCYLGKVWIDRDSWYAVFDALKALDVLDAGSDT